MNHIPPLTLFNAVLLFSTAFFASGLNAIAGGGSFITFPVLIFTGVPPITANATNNTAIWFGVLGSVRAYRQDFGIPRNQLVLLCGISLIGSVIGSVALLFTSAAIFDQLIPYLLLLATLIFLFGEPLRSWLQRHRLQRYRLQQPRPASRSTLALVQLAIAIYGGFFGAGLGILMLAAFTLLGFKNIHTMNAFKTFLGSCINGIAIVPFVFAGIIAWQQAILMAVGSLLGGYFSAYYARRLDPRWVRRFVSAVAVSMTIYFFVRS
ncbi:sulfite exporter TauE/SafE family protein [Leptolyngbya sp. NK1-12]|uniref:Probable membrane transporter protein n=1 Tax=Leptolyngbya sp. NK1-12 TaxID=2547451 RepID=A0AA96WLV0_9CYAN|nr:sulfite exporter TauE/SafE family protein [Leptolyngbya sp. NK1-12]WNZ27050.1 sulfite exporter TauE/SafE family protein [Leptolyngbya sp. NK1-12]